MKVMTQITTIKLVISIIFIFTFVYIYFFIYLPEQNKNKNQDVSVSNINNTTIPNTITTKTININDEIQLKQEEIPSLNNKVEEEENNNIASIPNVNIPEPITRDNVIGVIIKPLTQTQKQNNDIVIDDNLIMIPKTPLAVPNTLTITGLSTFDSINERFLGIWKTFGENKVGVQLNNPTMESTSIPYKLKIYPSHLTTNNIGKVYWKQNKLFPTYTSLLIPFVKDSIKGFLFSDVKTIDLPNPNVLLQNPTTIIKEIELPLYFLTNENSDVWFISINNDDIKDIPKTIRIQRWDNKRFIGTSLTTKLTYIN